MSETLNTSNTRAVKKETFIAALLNTDGNISKACGQTNISRTTIYDWIKKDDSFQEKVINVSEELLDMAEDQLLKQIRDGNLTATIFYLKTKGQARGYIEKQYVHQTQITTPIKVFEMDEVVLE
jgi:predicted DNA-binding protein YlxM (UPF0122 family)